MTKPQPAPHHPGPQWRTSSYSGNTGGQCIQVAIDPASSGTPCLVRDSKNTTGSHLAFTAHAWRTFTAAIKGGDLDLG